MIDYKMHAEPGHYQFTGHPINATHTATKTAIKKNWWLISIYVIVNLVSIYMGNFVISAVWLDVIVSILVLLFTTWIGYYMMCKVETITKETR